MAILLSLTLSIYAQTEKEDCTFEVSGKAKKLYKKAVKELQGGNESIGSKYFAEAIEESPNYLQALWAQARLNKDPRNRYRKEDLAVAAYMQIIEICPSYKNFYSYYHLGVLQYERKKYDASYKYLELFLAADDDKIREKHYEDALDLSKYAKFYYEIYAEPVPFEPKKLSDISTMEDEYLPSLSPDNELLYFTRRSKPKAGGPSRGVGRSGSGSIEQFCISQRQDKLKFEKGDALPQPFNIQSNEGGAALSIDNKELFYTRCELQEDRTLNCDICYSKFAYGEWSEVEALDDNVNTKQAWESMPTINSDGTVIYFVSDRDGGFGGYDIYRSNRDSLGNWSKAVNMGPTINTAGNEKSPFMHIDSQTLYFSSSDRKDNATGEWFAGHMGLGGYDIFYTRLDDANSWLQPKNIGYPINSQENDLGFFVSINGEDGFFASNKIGVKKRSIYKDENAPKDPWNIYTFKLYKKARPQKVLLVKGSFKDEETNEAVRDVSIEIKNVKTKEVKKVKVNNETGDYAFAMVMKSDYTMTVKKKDYTYETKYISADNTQEEQEVAQEEITEITQVEKEEETQELAEEETLEEITEEKKQEVREEVKLDAEVGSKKAVKLDVERNVVLKMDIAMKPVRIGKSYDLEDVYFSTNSAELNNKSKSVIDGFFEFLYDNPNIKVEIQGHTDNVGDNQFNLVLSRDRAKSVYEYLLNKGISKSQISSKGYGETKPISTNATEEGRAKNRRTVFVIISK